MRRDFWCRNTERIIKGIKKNREVDAEDRANKGRVMGIDKVSARKANE
jgi:hypothetical protein